VLVPQANIRMRQARPRVNSAAQVRQPRATSPLTDSCSFAGSARVGSRFPSHCCSTVTDCAGSANPNNGSVSAVDCQLCAPGRFMAAAGAVVCSECAAGKYSAAAGQSACTLCAAGPCHNAERRARSVDGLGPGSNSEKSAADWRHCGFVSASCRSLRCRHLQRAHGPIGSGQLRQLVNPHAQIGLASRPPCCIRRNWTRAHLFCVTHLCLR